MAFGLPAVGVTLVGKPALAPLPPPAPPPTRPPGHEIGTMTFDGSLTATMVPAVRAPAVLPGPVVVVVPPSSPLIVIVPASVPLVMLLLPHTAPLPLPTRFLAGGGVSVQAEAARTPAKN